MAKKTLKTFDSVAAKHGYKKLPGGGYLHVAGHSLHKTAGGWTHVHKNGLRTLSPSEVHSNDPDDLDILNLHLGNVHSSQHTEYGQHSEQQPDDYVAHILAGGKPKLGGVVK